MNERNLEQRLDDAIDSAARELTRGAPGVDFTGRVRARIQRSSWHPWLYWSTAAIAGAALIMALVLPSQAPDRIPARGTAAATAPPAPPAVPAIHPPERPLQATRPSRPLRAARRESAPKRWRIPVTDESVQLAPLTLVTELTVSVNEPASLELADLSFPDLVVPPLDPEHDHKELR